ncbi:hypothetical protein [Sphingopyxis macrogoltabida]|uniref:Uncharacterized protein n=1 Tax=Sphingopyxis macrogoltabida TaxID=33050 RepID=A0AAC9AW68_SPHMC|nr:hypothetical protein [Sphingopyxis macrogoltabida]ALJ14264.1 hypothetical protein LH19_15445 [Sphingopyxis macrogoltabida]AMU90529.1 hypothetical protein ATM17_16015 [Sphingopyxis macrogoltabida]
MIGRRLTMVAHVLRNVATGKDAFGHPAKPDYQPHGALRCFSWAPKVGVDAIVEGQKVAVKQDVRMMFALSGDLLPGDRIAQVTNRDGSEIHFRGPLRIEGEIDFKHTHREVALVRVA